MSILPPPHFCQGTQCNVGQYQPAVQYALCCTAVGRLVEQCSFAYPQQLLQSVLSSSRTGLLVGLFITVNSHSHLWANWTNQLTFVWFGLWEEGYRQHMQIEGEHANSPQTVLAPRLKLKAFLLWGDFQAILYISQLPWILFLNKTLAWESG